MRILQMCLATRLSPFQLHYPVQRSGGEYLVLLWGHEDLTDVPCHMTIPSLPALYLCRGVEVNISYCCEALVILQTCLATCMYPPY
jgi:hypothetical protein